LKTNSGLATQVIPMRTSFCYTIALLLAIAVCAACEPSEEIKTYTVERTSPPGEPFVAEEVAGQLDRMLTAMLPVGDQVYFFKLVGKKPVVDRHREEFENFVGDVAKGDAADKPITWVLPEGWTEKGPTEMRLNTVVVPDEAGDLEIAISSLPLSGNWDAFVESNVNRWLDQLGQGELPRQTILNLTKQLKTGAGTATVIELAGVMKETGPMMNPRAGATTSRPAAPAPQAPAVEAPAATGAIAYEAPAGWEKGPASPMREATYLVSDGDSKAEFTLSGWPAAPGSQMSDVTANVQRWAAQVGVPVDDNLAGLVEDMDIDGTKGSYVKLVGPDSGQAMLAAMVVRGEKVWFFKLTGAAKLVEAQAEDFRKFVDSVKFN
jgi:hypothetical protein